MMSLEMKQALHELYLRDATVHASMLTSMQNRLSEVDALAATILHVSKAKNELESQLRKHLAERQPSVIKCEGQCRCQRLGDFCNGEHHPLCNGGAP